MIAQKQTPGAGHATGGQKPLLKQTPMRIPDWTTDGPHGELESKVSWFTQIRHALREVDPEHPQIATIERRDDHAVRG